MNRNFKPTLQRISLAEAEKYTPEKENFTNDIDVYFYTLKPSNDPIYHINDGWEDVTYYTKQPTALAFIPHDGLGDEKIYVMSNPSIPTLLKIGYTDRPILERRKELSKSTSTPTPFKLEYYYCVPGRGLRLEEEIHNYLHSKRVKAHDPEFSVRDKEFFSCTLQEAIDTIKKLGKRYNGSEGE